MQDLQKKLLTCHQHDEYLAKSLDASKQSQEQKFLSMQVELTNLRNETASAK